MDAAIISLLATMIALTIGGFWLLRRAIHKNFTDIRKDIIDQYTDTRKAIADQNTETTKDSALQYTDIRQDIAELRQDHARLEGMLETLLKIMRNAINAESANDTTP